MAGPGYDAPAAAGTAAGADGIVLFRGDDGRSRAFDFGKLPMPGWRPLLAAAFAWRTGPSGGLATRESAMSLWATLIRWTRYLAVLADPPQAPGDLQAAHVDAFYERPDSALSTRMGDLRELRLLFASPAARTELTREARDAFGRRIPGESRDGGLPGYSDGELARLLAVVRDETRRARARIRAGENLLQRYRDAPRSLTPADLELGAHLDIMDRTGQVPGRGDGGPNWRADQRLALASSLFLTIGDLPAPMLLMAALSHRNGETVKELPARHRILEDRAVELVIVKRRHGARRWYETVTWEIGPPGRELHYPGGLYLMLLEMTARSRRWCGSPLAVCVWRSGHATGVQGTAEHAAPFEEHLKGATLRLAEWAASREPPLLADARTDDEPAAPLPVTFNRIKTSMDVRRTRQMGGHLPSAVRSNTMQVLFRNYLTGDPVIARWAEEVFGDALADAEQSALSAHHRALGSAGGQLRVVPGPVSEPALRAAGLDDAAAGAAARGELDTAWAGCTDHEHHPLTGKGCQVTFLDCFHCGNCLITRDHLPGLLALLDALSGRRREVSEEEWWERYGPAWAAIRHDILAKFSPAEVERAQASKSPDLFLELAENPWESP